MDDFQYVRCFCGHMEDEHDFECQVEECLCDYFEWDGEDDDE